MEKYNKSLLLVYVKFFVGLGIFLGCCFLWGDLVFYVVLILRIYYFKSRFFGCCSSWKVTN